MWVFYRDPFWSWLCAFRVEGVSVRPISLGKNNNNKTKQKTKASTCYVKCHLDIGQKLFLKDIQKMLSSMVRNHTRESCLCKSKTLFFPQCITPKWWDPLLGITSVRTHCNFVALKRQDGVELLVGQMSSILTFNFSTRKVEITPTSHNDWGLSLSKCLAHRRCSVSNHSIIFSIPLVSYQREIWPLEDSRPL